MLGTNKILKAENHKGHELNVQEIFPTVQGEGPYVGRPAVFVRLGGCNLACDFCDTEFDSYRRMTLERILNEVENLANNSSKKLVRKLVVITGGEPLRQPIERLCEELLRKGFLVQIETNGTIFRQLPSEVMIVCSPKVTNGKYHAIRPDLLPRINAFKFIISANRQEYSNVAYDLVQVPIYIQPMDEGDAIKNQKNLQLVLQLVESCGYLLSLQIHKIIGIK